MSDFTIKFFVSAVLALVIKGVVAIAHHSIAWWLAAVIAVALVFGGVFIWVVFVDGDGSWD